MKSNLIIKIDLKPLILRVFYKVFPLNYHFDHQVKSGQKKKKLIFNYRFWITI